MYNINIIDTTSDNIISFIDPIIAYKRVNKKI